MGLNLPNYEILCQQTKQNNCQTKTKSILSKANFKILKMLVQQSKHMDGAG